MELRIDLHIHKHEAGANPPLQKDMDKIMADLTALTQAVAQNTNVEQSAVVALQGLKAALDAAGTDPVQLKALSDQLGATDDALAAAIVATNPTAAAAAVAAAKVAAASVVRRP